jgi:hypothetical protein
VVLEAEGRRFVAAPQAERTAIWRGQLLTLRLFRQLVAAMQREPRRRIERDAVLEILAIAMPQEDVERVFGTLVRWAQAGDLFDYDDRSEELVMERPD